MKPKKRPHWPTHWHKVDENLSVFLGGTGNCGVLKNGNQFLLINCNSGPSSLELQKYFPENSKLTLVGTTAHPDYISGARCFRWEKVYLPDNKNYSNEELQKLFSLEKTSDPCLHTPKESGKSQDINFVDQKLEIEWGDEKVTILHSDNAFSKSDLVVYLHNRKTLFTGGMTFNNIHPILDSDRGMKFDKWTKTLRLWSAEFPIDTVVPHEGDLDDAQTISRFCEYLETLSKPSTEFSYCRKNFDWMEIPGYTSLEENYDFIRQNIKS